MYILKEAMSNHAHDVVHGGRIYFFTFWHWDQHVASLTNGILTGSVQA